MMGMGQPWKHREKPPQAEGAVSAKGLRGKVLAGPG